MRDGIAGTITLLGGRVDAGVAEDLALRVGAAIENARLFRTRAAIAQTLQRSLLPPELPRDPRASRPPRLYRPAGEGNEVGGDFYDLFSTGEREWFAVIGDVCGKGAEAATVTALARYTIRAAVTRHRSPAGILRWLNAAMLRQRAGRFVTLALRAAAARADGTVTRRPSSCGGHPCPRILRATGLVEELGAHGHAARRAATRSSSSDRSARLAPGDALVLYTDGLTEVERAGRVDAGAARRRGRRRAPHDAQGIVEHLAAQTPGTAARRPGAARAAGSALAVGIDVDVVDPQRAARWRSGSARPARRAG